MTASLPRRYANLKRRSAERVCRSHRLGRLRLERREVEGRLREIESVPVHAADPDAIVDALLEGLADARRLFEQGTMEERKRVVRAFVDGLKVVGSKRSGEIRMKKLPALELVSAGSSVESLAGVLYEVQKRNRTWMLQVVRVRFAVRGTALVPVRGRRIAPSSRDGTAQGPERMAALCGVGSPSGDDGPGPWPGCFRPN